MSQTVTIITSALIGAVVSYLGAVLKNFMDMRSKVDESLRESRIPVYQVLWTKTGLLPKWPRSEDVTYEKLGQLSEDLRDWYFKQGGMLLSKKARSVYGDLQDTIGKVLKRKAKGKISDPHYDQVRDVCSKLRTELTNDLLSRRRAPFMF